MATVYLAEDLKHHRRVAVKVLRPELAATLGAERFVREIEIAAGLTHPHILPLHDSGDTDGFLYYVMPYIEGESLRERLNCEGKLSVEDTIRITDQVASALSYAHERGVVHRDVKPENIMLAGDQAIVADFGIARAVQVARGERLTGTGLAIGTPAYMSPEQALGQENVDGRSDVYALGCVVYEMVGGRAPFEGATPQALLAKHAVDAAPGLRASDPAIPVFVERAVEKALAKTPADRFQSAGAFAEALTSGTVVARVGPRRGRRRTVAGAAAVVVLLAALGGWLTTMGGPAIQRLAVLPPANLMNAPDQEHIVQGMHNALITELGQAGITVIGGLQSMMRYRNTEQTVREIADELGVDGVIEPSVFWAGDSVGIDVRLIDGRTEEALWSQSYDADSRNVVALYREVTRAIAGEIQLALTPQAEARLAHARSVDPQAHEAYLRGRFHSEKLTPADLERALQYFELALEHDPDYAEAYAGVAWVWAARRQMGLVSADQAMLHGVAAAVKAVELDSTVAAAQQVLGTVRAWGEWDWGNAETAYQRAIALNPSYGDVRADYSHLLMVIGRPDEAMAQIDTALQIDSLNVKFQAFYGILLLFAGRQYDSAIVQFRNVLRTVPNHPLGRKGLTQAFHEKGMYDQVLEQKMARAGERGDQELREALARGYAEAGYTGAMLSAAETLAARARTTFVRPTRVAALYGYAGEKDETLYWLEKAFAARDSDMPYAFVAPVNDFLQDDPQFQSLLRRMNLPQ
jgi:serine/threonine-protein kinase